MLENPLNAYCPAFSTVSGYSLGNTHFLLHLFVGEVVSLDLLKSLTTSNVSNSFATWLVFALDMNSGRSHAQRSECGYALLGSEQSFAYFQPSLQRCRHSRGLNQGAEKVSFEPWAAISFMRSTLRPVSSRWNIMWLGSMKTSQNVFLSSIMALTYSQQRFFWKLYTMIHPCTFRIYDVSISPFCGRISVTQNFNGPILKKRRAPSGPPRSAYIGSLHQILLSMFVRKTIILYCFEDAVFTADRSQITTCDLSNGQII